VTSSTAALWVMTRKAHDEHISSARPVRCAATSTIWSEDSTRDLQTSVPCAHHKAEIKKRRPIIKAAKSKAGDLQHSINFNSADPAMSGKWNGRWYETSVRSARLPGLTAYR